MVQPSRTIRPTVLDELARSASLIRSVSVVLGVVVEHRHRDLRDDRPGVDAGVDEEQRGAGDLHAVGERVARAVDAGERRQQRVVGVDVAAAERGQEARARPA